MKIKAELIKPYIADVICDWIGDFVFDADEIANTKAIKILDEIQKVIQNTETDDFYKVEEIVCIFEKYKISAGGCHDFG